MLIRSDNLPARRAYTLVELMFSLAGATVVLAGLSSAMFIGVRGTDTSGSHTTAVIDGNAALSTMLSDLEFAIDFSEQTSNAITFTIPDRTGDDNPDTVRYAWSGTPGDPLTVQRNGGTIANVVEDVYVFEHDLPAQAANLIVNPGFESGTTGWSASTCMITIDPSGDYFSGAQCLAVYGLSLPTSGPYQSITAPIASDTEYDVEAWIKMTSGSANFVFDLQVSTTSGTFNFETQPVLVDTGWTNISASLKPSWIGSVTSATLKISNRSNYTAFKVDDVSMRPDADPHQHVNCTLQVGSDSRARVSSGVWMMNSPL